MGTTFDVDGAVFSTLDRYKQRLREDPYRRSSTDIRRAVANEKLKRSSSKMYRSTGDLLDDDNGAIKVPKFPEISSAALSSMLTGGRYGSEINVVGTAPVQPAIRQSITRPTLPALLEVSDLNEDEFIRRVVSSEAERLQYQLVPSFLFYMATRFYLSPYYRGAVADEQRRQRVRLFFIRTVERIRLVSKDYRLPKESIAFWLSNSSELLNIMKQDKELKTITAGEPQKMMTDVVESLFDLLCVNLKDQLRVTINSFIDTRITDRVACSETIAALDETMRLLRRCRLNIALTIQLFSQLFHFINAYLFNWLVSPSGATYCSTAFGVRLRTRLRAVHEWTEQQGLEIAALCHMDRIQQAVTLLTTSKGMDQIANLGTTCYKLNSIQVRHLLEHIVLDVDEERVSRELVESVVRLAETLADDMARQDGTGIQLEEQLTLQLPFLLPQDGYSIDLLRGVPSYILEWVNVLQSQGLCNIIPQPSSSGSWTVHFNDDVPNDPVLTEGSLSNNSNQISLLSRSETKDPCDSCFKPSPDSSNNLITRNGGPVPVYDSSRSSSMQTNFGYSEPRNPEIVLVSLNRGSSSIGLSIVAAQGIGERCVGIYVKKVVDGSPAARDGRLKPGDQLLSVNGQSLVGISQEEAASKMASAGPNITFEVNKHAARYNGLSDWLNCPSAATTSQAPNYSNLDQSMTMYDSISNSSTLQSDRRAPTATSYGDHSERRAPAAIGYGDHSHYVRQHSVSSATPTYSTGGYADKSAQYGSVNVQPHQLARNGMNHYECNQSDAQLRNNSRSLSATELYQNMAPGSSTNSVASLPPRGLLGTSSGHMYAQGTGHLAGHQNLPSRYRVGLRDAIRPAVIQPSRPTASPRNARRTVVPSAQTYGFVPSTSSLGPQARNTSMSMPQYPYRNGQAASSVDYINVHCNDPYMSSPPSDTSLSSSTASHSHSCIQNQVSTARVMPNISQTVLSASPFHFPSKYGTSYSNSLTERNLPISEYSQDSLNAPSSSSTSDLRYVSDVSPSNNENGTRQIPSEVPKDSTVNVVPSKRDELNEELDRLESKGSAMTAADQRKYRQLVNELSKVREPILFKTPNRQVKEKPLDVNLSSPLSSKENGDVGKTSQGDQTSDELSLASSSQLRDASVESNGPVVTRMNDKDAETFIGELQKGMEDLTVGSPSEEVAKIVEKSAVSTEKSAKIKKGVKWDEENIEVSNDDSKHLVFKDAGEAEPRVQVLGTQEVYRDPRLRRLNEIQAKKNASQPSVDGANLGFRDKMRLFAEQAGEKSLKSRYKTSSAQREIEQALD